MHKDIREVRAPRQAKKNEPNVSIRYAFIEFADEDEAEKAKSELAAKNFNVFVDYVGEKSSKESFYLIFLLQILLTIYDTLNTIICTLRQNMSHIVTFLPLQKKPAPASESAINPLRLVVSGVVSGLSEDKLKQLFPKCYEAQVGFRIMMVGVGKPFLLLTDGSSDIVSVVTLLSAHPYL